MGKIREKECICGRKTGLHEFIITKETKFYLCPHCAYEVMMQEAIVILNFSDGKTVLEKAISLRYSKYLEEQNEQAKRNHKRK